MNEQSFELIKKRMIDLIETNRLITEENHRLYGLLKEILNEAYNGKRVSELALKAVYPTTKNYESEPPTT